MTVWILVVVFHLPSGEVVQYVNEPPNVDIRGVYAHQIDCYRDTPMSSAYSIAMCVAEEIQK